MRPTCALNRKLKTQNKRYGEEECENQVLMQKYNIYILFNFCLLCINIIINIINK